MVMAARAAGVDVYDTPFTDVNDDEGIYTDAEYAKSLGFTGKSAISPRHVNAINEVFSPTAAEIDYAYEVMDAIRAAVDLPIAAGFGISTQAQAEIISKHADGFVVGSALVKRLGAEGKLEGDLLP